MAQVFVESYNEIVDFPDSMSEEEQDRVLETEYPLTPQLVVDKLRDPSTPSASITEREYDIFRQFDDTWTWEGAARMAEGALTAVDQILSEMWEGAKATAEELGEGNLKRVGGSLDEGIARGTLEIAQLGLKGLNHAFNGIQVAGMEKETGGFQRFKGLKSIDNLIDAAHKGDVNLLGGIIGDENIRNEIAVLGSDIADITTFAGLPGSKAASRISSGIGRGVEKAGNVASAVGSGANDILRQGKEAFTKAKAGVEEAAPGLSSGKFGAGVAGAAAVSMGLPAAGAIGGALAAPTILELGGGAMQGLGRAMQNTPTRIGTFRGLATQQPGTLAGAAAGRLTFLDGPLDAAGAIASGVVAGATVGAGLGFAAEGWEGAAGGLGSGGALGGLGAGTMRAYQGLSGRQRSAAIQSDWNRFFAEDEGKLKDWANKEARSDRQKATMMDTISVLLKGSDVKIRAEDQAWFDENNKGSTRGFHVVEGDSPTVVLNTDKATSRTLAHESIHALAKLDGASDFIKDVNREIGETMGNQSEQLLARYRSLLSKGVGKDSKALSDWDAMPLESKMEEVAAEYFAAYLEGQNPDFILKGTRSDKLGGTAALDAFDWFAKRSTSQRFRRITGALESRLYGDSRNSDLLGDIPRSREVDSLLRDMVKARRRSYKATALASGREVRSYITKDLADDETFKRLESQGLAYEQRGKRILASKGRSERADKERSQAIIDALDSVGPSEGGLVQTESGEYTGRFYSPAQIEALKTAGVIDSRMADKWLELHKGIEDGHVMNVTYNAATKKVRSRTKNLQGRFGLQSKYNSRIPVSNRDVIPMFTNITKAGQNTVKFLDWSSLLSKAADAHGKDGSAVAKLWKTQSALESDLARFVGALHDGSTPTKQIFGEAKRNQLNKLVEARNTKGNPELPRGGRFNERSNIWKDFRLDRIEAMEVRPENIRFSQEGYEKAQENFSPAKEGSLWDIPNQEFSSKGTARGNQFGSPKTLKAVKWEEGTVNADIGGGPYDNFTNALAEKGVRNVVYDPFNRGKKHNTEAVEAISNGQADTATSNNVLNVIQEATGRDKVIRQAANAIKSDGKAYFLIYEGNKTGNSRKSQEGSWQEHRKAASYESEISKRFNSVKRRGSIIEATEPKEQFSPSAEGRNIDSTSPFKRMANGAVTEGPGLVQFSPMAYHGTPHKVDKFSTENIGSGEGAQAYGWGLYFAESKAVAKQYRDDLSRGEYHTVDGEPADYRANPKHLAARELHMTKGDRPRAIDSLSKHSGRMKRRIEAVKDRGGKAVESQVVGTVDAAIQLLIDGHEGTVKVERDDGNLYQVDLKAKESELLDWDKPLSEQSPEVRKAFKENYKPGRSLKETKETALSIVDSMRQTEGVADWVKDALTEIETDINNSQGQESVYIAVKDIDAGFGLGHQMWSRVAREINSKIQDIRLDSDPILGSRMYAEAATQIDPFKPTGPSRYKSASKDLLSKGIKGIRYADGFSRGADGGENKTYNYVMFDEADISIVKENDVRLSPSAPETPAAKKKREDQYEQVKEPGELTDAEDVKALPMEGGEINWRTSEHFSPSVDPEAFPLMDDGLMRKILNDTDKIGVMHIDRLKVGEYEGTELQGGMFYAAIKENLEKGYVWAFNTPSPATGAINRAMETGGYVKLVLMEEGNVVGNKTFGEIWFKGVRDSISSGRLKERGVLKELNGIRRRYSSVKSNVAGKVKESGTGHKKAFKTLDEAQEAIMGLPQTKRATYYFKKGKGRRGGKTVTTYGNLLRKELAGKGFPDAEKIVPSIEEGAFAGVPSGATVAILRIDPNQKPVLAKDVGLTPHISYPWVIKGQPVARLKYYNVVEKLFPDDKGLIAKQASQRYPADEIFATQKAHHGELAFSPSKPLNKRGGMLYNTPSGHKAIQLSSRSKIRVYGPNGNRIGLLYNSIEDADKAVAKLGK